MITVDMLMFGFKFIVARFEAIVDSRDKEIVKVNDKIAKVKARAAYEVTIQAAKASAHAKESKRASEAAKKMREFLV